MKFKVFDMKANRNVDIAPAYTDVSKVMVESHFEELSKAPWDITGCAYYYNSLYQPDETKIMEDALLKTKTSYRFYKNEQGKKYCIISSLNPKTNEIEDSDPYPVVIVDDVIYLFYTEAETGETKDIYMWVTDWKTKNGSLTFIDKKNERLGNDISVIITTDQYLVQRKE